MIQTGRLHEGRAQRSKQAAQLDKEPSEIETGQEQRQAEASYLKDVIESKATGRKLGRLINARKSTDSVTAWILRGFTKTCKQLADMHEAFVVEENQILRNEEWRSDGEPSKTGCVRSELVLLSCIVVSNRFFPLLSLACQCHVRAADRRTDLTFSAPLIFFFFFLSHF